VQKQCDGPALNRVNTLPRLSINPPEIQKGPLLYIVQTEFTFKVCSLLHCALYLKICIVTISLKPDIMKIMMIHHPKRFTWTLSSSIIKKLSYIHNSSIGMKEGTGNGEPLFTSRHLSVLIFWYFKQINIFICYLHTLCVLCYLCVLVFRFHAWRWCIIEHSDAHSVIVHSINYCPKVALASSGRTWRVHWAACLSISESTRHTLSRHFWTTESPEPASPRRIPS